MKRAFIFPGQGAQYSGMGKDFFDGYQIAKHTFEEADDLLGRKLSDIIFNGPSPVLTETGNSQLAIFVVGIAILRVVDELFPEIKPSICAGLSLGEYTAAVSSGYFSFSEALQLVQHRSQYMNDACEKTHGKMAVVLGLEANVVEELVRKSGMPRDLWAANYNCPGQVVISGTAQGIEAGTVLAKEFGAKRVLPLDVHGAFHSGLMEEAEKRLAEHVREAPVGKPSADLIMNVTGKKCESEDEFRENLIRQVTSPVRWEQGIREMEKAGVQLYLEFGPGKTLSGFNKRIGVSTPTISIEKAEDIKILEEFLVHG